MSELKRAIDLAELMVAQDERVKALSEELAKAKESFNRTRSEDLPELMRELGLSSFSLSDGNSVEVKDEVDCAITQANREAAHAWLIENGFGGLIKTAVSIEFGRGEREQAEAFSSEVEESTGHVPLVVDGVHSATLKSFVKEQMAAGNSIPFDLFSIRPYSVAKLVKAKKSKAK